jgi:hypothetical protein
MTKSFWKIPVSEGTLRTPVTLLREQAALLGNETGGALRGFVGQGIAPSGYFGFSFGISVPALNNYTYLILTIIQPPLMYPLTVKSPTLNFEENIENEEQLEAALEKILGSEEMQRVIAALLAQAKPQPASG